MLHNTRETPATHMYSRGRTSIWVWFRAREPPFGFGLGLELDSGGEWQRARKGEGGDRETGGDGGRRKGKGLMG